MACGQWTVAGASFAIALAVGVAAQDATEVLKHVRTRLERLDRLRIDFTFVMIRTEIEKDPFDSQNWDRREGYFVRFDCQARLVRPDFWIHSGTEFVSGLRDVTHSWIDGRQVRKGLIEDGTWSITVTKERYSIHGPMPLLTPFEMQICEVDDSLVELLQRGRLSVTSATPEEIVLAGSPNPDADPPWKVRAVLDPRRSHLPVEMTAELNVMHLGKPRRIFWITRPLRTEMVNGVDAIAEAVMALSPGVEGVRWQLYHFNATSIACDPSLGKSALVIALPTRGYNLVDKTTFETRIVDPEGRVTLAEQLTQQEMREREISMSKTLAMNLEEKTVRRERERAFTRILWGAAAFVAICAGVLAWRHFSPRRTSPA